MTRPWRSSSRHGERGQCGFTLIEILIVISIIGVLVALLVPAVQAAREAARRASCVSNLRQIGQAMHLYTGDNGMFPPSQLVTGRGPNGQPYSSNAMSQHSYMLPYLEQSSLFSSINMNFAETDTPESPSLENGTARNTRLAVFLCPSDMGTEIWNNYRWNRGRFGTPGYPYWDGPFSMTVLPTPAAITDGLSRTAFASERIGGTFLSDSFDRNRDVKYPSEAISYSNDYQYAPSCLAAVPSSWITVSGRYWLYSGPLFTSYSHLGVPNDRDSSCAVSGSLRDGPGGLCPPRSFHPGCVNVLFGDGHVESVANSIDPKAWASLGTYNAGD